MISKDRFAEIDVSKFLVILRVIDENDHSKSNYF